MIRLFVFPIITVFIGFLFNVGAVDNSIEPSAYPEHLGGTFTGGFGEKTCRSCHFDYGLNPPGGNLSITGIGDDILPGEQLELHITVTRQDLGRAGFQLTARYPNGSQAGRFVIDHNERVIFTETMDSVQYVQHSKIGSNPSGEKASWVVTWLAPASPLDTVVFHVAANAANGDQSELGDYIFAKRKVLVWQEK